MTTTAAGNAGTDTSIVCTAIATDVRLDGVTERKRDGGNCGLPPGQAKKYGCQTYTYEGRPHYYYQDELGRIVVRRPIIEVHGSVVVH